MPSARALPPQASVSSADARRQLTRGHCKPGRSTAILPVAHPIKTLRFSPAARIQHFRVAWRKRIIDHDGDGKIPVNREWLKLVEGTGLYREQAINGEGILLPHATLCRPTSARLAAHRISKRWLFPDGTLQQDVDLAAHGPHARTLPMARSSARIFQGAPDASPRRREFCLGLLREARPHPRAAGACLLRTARQVRYSVGASSTRCISPM